MCSGGINYLPLLLISEVFSIASYAILSYSCACFLRVHFSSRIDLEVQQEHLTAVQILPLLLYTWCLLCLKERRDWRLEKVYGNRGKTSSLEEVPCAEL